MASAEDYRIVVLVSGSGTNLQALIDDLHLPVDSGVICTLVVSSKDGVAALDRARAAAIDTAVVSMAGHNDREARDRKLAEVVAAATPDLVVLAGFMSILTGEFLNRFPDRVINLHPSLLPSFPGVDAIGQALAWGVRITGVTVHFAEEEVDAGPPVLQEAVPVLYDDSIDDLSARIRDAEHRLLPAAVRLFSEGRVSRNPSDRRRVNVTEV